MIMGKFIRLMTLFAVSVLTVSCMEWEGPEGDEEFEAPASALFICSEGNFQYGNATLSCYDPATNKVENEIFYRANGMRLGDVAQSMSVYGNRGWICVNNSHVVFAIDLNTFREVGRVENIGSPRYIHFVSPRKAYVTQIWDNRIYVVDPETYQVTGHITVPGMDLSTGSTEQMAQWNEFVFCTCWSYQNKVIKIDSSTDEVVDELVVGIQPRGIVADRYGKLWVLTDGGYQGSPAGYEAPSLVRINPETFTVEQRFEFRLGDSPSSLQLDGSGSTLYWINNHIWKMDVLSSSLPAHPFLEQRGTRYFGLTVNPANDEVYVADAIDYQQQGIIYRYSPQAVLTDEFYAGVIPSAFCWK